MSTRVVVVNVHDPVTGWSTQPVAAVGWRPGAIVWEWMPLSPPGRDLRFGVIEDLDPAAQEQWLENYLREPTAAYSVQEIPEMSAGELEVAAEDDAVVQAARDIIDQLIVAGY